MTKEPQTKKWGKYRGKARSLDKKKERKKEWTTLSVPQMECMDRIKTNPKRQVNTHEGHSIKRKDPSRKYTFSTRGEEKNKFLNE